ncbi:hypothetical protein [Mesorhizobium sp.]|uniref:hypothetical protein n=1 Tax=Mesorhizobium sp. TaxID=1871066 RepID=UPI000FE2F32B|nr:hypothetical protein [Mesorhizobium sp.]
MPFCLSWLPESRPGCEFASETPGCHRPQGATQRSTLANAGQFAYDQALIMAQAFIMAGSLRMTSRNAEKQPVQTNDLNKL